MADGEARTIDRLMADHGFFSALGPADIELIAGCGRNLSMQAGGYLFKEAEAADRFFIVRKGRVALELRAPGRHEIIIDSAGPDDVVGFSWLFPPHRWQYDGRVIEDIRAIEFDGACLRNKCDADPALGYRLMQRFAEVLSRRMHSARIRLLDMYGNGDG